MHAVCPAVEIQIRLIFLFLIGFYYHSIQSVIHFDVYEKKETRVKTHISWFHALRNKDKKQKLYRRDLFPKKCPLSRLEGGEEKTPSSDFATQRTVTQKNRRKSIGRTGNSNDLHASHDNSGQAPVVFDASYPSRLGRSMKDVRQIRIHFFSGCICFCFLAWF